MRRKPEPVRTFRIGQRDAEMHRLTLRFRNRELEAAFRDYEVQDQILPTRITIYLCAFIGLAESLYRLVFLEGELTTFRLLCIFVFGLVALSSRLTHMAFVIKNRTWIGVVAFGLILTALSVTIVHAPLDRRASMFGFLLVLQTFNLVMPCSHIMKFVINLEVVIAAVVLFGVMRVAPESQAAVDAMQLALAVASGVVVAFTQERAQRRKFLLSFELADERQRSDQLLLNILPPDIARRLKDADDTSTVVDACQDAFVLFADIVGFSALARAVPPTQVVRLLDDLFSRFDMVADQHGLEKIKTIGDAYMCVTGVPEPSADGAKRMAEAALDLLAAVERYSLLSGIPLEVRIGFHVGPVVAGVIGRRKFLYDLWGDTVNIAARLEASGTPGTVHITRTVAERLEGLFELEPRGHMALKGVGTFETFTLRAKAVLKAVA